MIGDGLSTFQWHPHVPCFKGLRIGLCIILGRSLNAKVASIIHKGDWSLPMAILMAHTQACFLPHTGEIG